MLRFCLGMIFAASTLLAQDAQVAGNWIWTIHGPGGEDVNGDVVLKVDGKSVTGTFDFNGRKLEIESGTIEGKTLKILIKRQRPQGGTMAYRMTGTVEGDAITGNTVADMDGQAVEDTFKAKRKP